MAAEFEILECSENPQFRHLIGFQTGKQSVVHCHPTAIRGQRSGDHVEKGGFPRPVGTDNGLDGLFMYIERYLIHRMQAAEGFVKIANPEYGICFRGRFVIHGVHKRLSFLFFLSPGKM